MADNYSSYSKERPGKHPQQYPLCGGYIVVDDDPVPCAVYESGPAKPSLPQFLGYLPRVLQTWKERDESCSIPHTMTHFILLERPLI